jgi:hypothetical protein
MADEMDTGRVRNNRSSLSWRLLREKTDEGSSSCINGAINIGCRTYRNLADGRLGRRIDDVDDLSVERFDPCAIDIDVGVISHFFLLMLIVGWTGDDVHSLVI